MGKRILIFLLPLFALSGLAQESAKSFRYYDSLTYVQYMEGRWKELIRSGNAAIREGNDYYYLRLRLGVAWFERQNYLQAARNFEAAMQMNGNDPFTGEYLFDCYMSLNRPGEALEVYDKLPSSLKEKLKDSLPRLHSADVSGGLVFSDEPDKFDHFDLDGDSSYYGEVDLTRDGTDFNAGLSWQFENRIKIYGGYTWIHLNKNKLVSIGDTLAVDDQYPLDQHQFYLSGFLPLWKGFSVRPAVNYLLDNYDVVMSQYDSASNNYDFPVVSNKLNAYIAFLEVMRDFQVVRTGLFGGYSNLNDRQQIQAGFHLIAYPFGNLDLYLSSRLLDHIVDGDHHFIFEQMVGGRLLKPLWAEINATFGEMIDYYENNAYVVYNFADQMDFKGGAKLIWTFYPRFTLSGEYIILHRQGNYVVYNNIGTDGEYKIVPQTNTMDFYNQIVILGLNWKF